MTKYIIKRILIAIPVLLGITVIDYAIMCMAGSPLEMLQGPRVSEAAVHKLFSKFFVFIFRTLYH